MDEKTEAILRIATGFALGAIALFFAAALFDSLLSGGRLKDWQPLMAGVLAIGAAFLTAKAIGKASQRTAEATRSAADSQAKVAREQMAHQAEQAERDRHAQTEQFLAREARQRAHQRAQLLKLLRTETGILQDDINRHRASLNEIQSSGFRSVPELRLRVTAMRLNVPEGLTIDWTQRCLLQSLTLGAAVELASSLRCHQIEMDVLIRQIIETAEKLETPYGELYLPEDVLEPLAGHFEVLFVLVENFERQLHLEPIEAMP